jgi:hypothetical protein
MEMVLPRYDVLNRRSVPPQVRSNIRSKTGIPSKFVRLVSLPQRMARHISSDSLGLVVGVEREEDLKRQTEVDRRS